MPRDVACSGDRSGGWRFVLSRERRAGRGVGNDFTHARRRAARRAFGCLGSRHFGARRRKEFRRIGSRLEVHRFDCPRSVDFIVLFRTDPFNGRRNRRGR